jgi:hypothetical protein
MPKENCPCHLDLSAKRSPRLLQAGKCSTVRSGCGVADEIEALRAGFAASGV